MRRLFLHVGFAKCGSTSLQHALQAYDGDRILYPKSGAPHGEHIALALHIRGVDDWTRQFYDEAWTAREYEKLMSEIAASDRDVVLSSERLAAMSSEEIAMTCDIFRDFQIEVIFVERAIDKYLSSAWRHAVYHHDYADSFEVFKERMKNFSFGGAVAKFRSHFSVHVFDMDDPNYLDALRRLFEVDINIPKSNVGVPLDFANLLQGAHALMGSKKFKAAFDMPTKREMLAVRAGKRSVDIDPLSVRLFS